MLSLLALPGHVHLGDQNIGGKDVRSVEEVVDPLRFLADRGDIFEQVVDVAGDGQVLDAPDDLAFLDLEGQGQRIGEGARDDVALPQAEQVLDQDALVDPGDDVLQGRLAGLDDEVGERGIGRSEQAARGIAGRFDPGLGGRLQVVDKALEHALLDQHVAAMRHAFVVVGRAGEAAVDRPIVHDGDLLVEELFTDLVLASGRCPCRLPCRSSPR